MMLLEQTITPIHTVITGEASKEGGSTVTVAPTTGHEQPVDRGQPIFVVVPTQSTPIQAPQLAVIPSSTTLPTVEDASATSSLFQQLPPNQMAGAQPMVFQTPPPPNQMASATSGFPDATTAKLDGRCITGGSPDTTTAKPDGRRTTGGFL
ncbi:unnamed protein product [Lactuca virosa]|uniref:Uncharacterized protein n=1 Tax=Lactuca virosa TaxID=75947 RepID=A0AAU9M5P2_9ASTR|nr:unnamed protein product [Lactuca virosa]